jgi:hypothetical protein
VRALLDSLTDGSGAASAADDGAAVRVTGARSWRSLPALYRENAVFVTASAAQGLEQAASGARVTGPLGSGTRLGAVRDELEAARAARPLTAAETRAALRDIFLSEATPARVAALVRAGQLPAALVGGRQVAVLAAVADAGQAGRLAIALLTQRLRPAEVIAAVSDPAAAGAVRSALGRLTEQGLRVVVSGAPLPDGPDAATGLQWAGLTSARPLARLSSAPWLAPWAPDGRQPDTYLLDLACARECAQADAVGLYLGEHGGTGEYEFTRWLDRPALVRAGLLAPGGPAVSDWGGHGLRLLTIADGQEAR